MNYLGRITATLVLILIITLWHWSYFWIDNVTAYRFFITENFIIYDFIYTPFLLPIIWFLGKQYDKAKFYSEKDILTKLYNRRFVLTFFPKQSAQVNRKNESLALIIFDCNNFKYINDTYGHKKGDMVLKGLASILSHQTRKGDIAARWGGDEFLIVAPFTNMEGCESIANRIQKELKAFSQEIGIHISVSIGAALSPLEGVTIDDLLHIADQRMYKKKNTNSVLDKRIKNKI